MREALVSDRLHIQDGGPEPWSKQQVWSLRPGSNKVLLLFRPARPGFGEPGWTQAVARIVPGLLGFECIHPEPVNTYFHQVGQWRTSVFLTA